MQRQYREFLYVPTAQFSLLLASYISMVHLSLTNNSMLMDFPGSSDGKASACNAGDLGSIPGSGRSPEERNGNPLQYSCLENPMDGGAWQATVHGVAKSQTQTERLHFRLYLRMLGEALLWRSTG